MPGWNELDKILRDVQGNQPSRPAEVSDEEKTRRGLLKLFSPVADVLMKLREAGVTTYNNTRLPIYSDTVRNVRQMTVPEVAVQLAVDTRLVIRVAHKPTLRYPDSVTQAKWRLRLIVRDHVCEEALVDNKDVMARWVMERVVSYYEAGNVSRHAVDTPHPGTSFDVDLDDEDEEELRPPPAAIPDVPQGQRQYRNISLDDEGDDHAGAHAP